jgi:hypothetical protein
MPLGLVVKKGSKTRSMAAAESLGPVSSIETRAVSAASVAVRIITERSPPAPSGNASKVDLVGQGGGHHSQRRDPREASSARLRSVMSVYATTMPPSGDCQPISETLH